MGKFEVIWRRFSYLFAAYGEAVCKQGWTLSKEYLLLKAKKWPGIKKTEKNTSNGSIRFERKSHHVLMTKRKWKLNTFIPFIPMFITCYTYNGVRPIVFIKTYTVNIRHNFLHTKLNSDTQQLKPKITSKIFNNIKAIGNAKTIYQILLIKYLSFCGYDGLHNTHVFFFCFFFLLFLFTRFFSHSFR